MKLYNCVMLSLSNPLLNQVHNELLRNYTNYISRDTTKKYGWNDLVETDPHVTLIYELTPGVGRNKLYHLIKIQNRDEYNNLRRAQFLTLRNPMINTFDNDGYRVLKLDLLDSDEFNLLKMMHEKLMQLPNKFEYGHEKYHPHLTLTYLKPDTPDSIIEEINSKCSRFLNRFLMKEFIISGSDDEGNVVEYQDRFM